MKTLAPSVRFSIYSLVLGMVFLTGVLYKKKIQQLITPIYLAHEQQRNLSVIIADTQATIYSPYLPVVAGFETLLTQFFQNLIANAIKFRRPNHTPLVSLTFAKIGELYHFKFQDNGIGIEPQYADSIFKLFTRLNNKEDFEGNGLGLSLCRRIIEKHGGEISVTSKGLGYGTTFSFSLHPPTF